MRFKVNRKKISFEYEFIDGEVVKIEYFKPTTQMIDAITEIETSDTKAQLSQIKETLRACLKGDEEKIEKIIDEQTIDSNLYQFKVELDEELGKLIKRK